MKSVMLLMLMISFCASYTYSQIFNCDPKCKDNSNSLFCIAWHRRTNCKNALVKTLYCPLTCQVCKPCVDNEPLLSGQLIVTPITPKCEIGTCVDEMPQKQCFTIANFIQDGCKQYGASCRKTCGLCKECENPPAPCISDCENKENFCDDWKENGYCNQSSPYHRYMQANCPLSCGLCKQCSTEAPPNTKLPPPAPTEPACLLSGCEDSNPSCEHWAENGYCNESKGFPFTRVTCPKSCKVCIQCSTELPPPAPTTPSCSEDCKENDPSCGFWKGEGYCNETSEFYSHMERVCPVTCGMCNPCSSKTEIKI